MLLEKVPQTIQQKKKQHTGLIHLKPELSSLVNSSKRVARGGGGCPGVPVTPPFVSLFVSRQPTIFR